MSNSSLVTPQYLITYTRPATVADYRPVVNAAGTQAIFERWAAGTSSDEATLYSLDLTQAGNTPTTFLEQAAWPIYSTRPDSFWQPGGTVAFTGSGPDGLQVGVANYDGSTPTALKHTGHMVYPTWYPDGKLAVMNRDKAASPNPNTTKIDLKGKRIATALGGPTLWGGMPSVNQAAPHLVAFAGQVVGSGKYDEDSNYIWVVDTKTNSAAPLESGCPPLPPFSAQYQGRAPWWSPDGKWVVFESYRASPPANGSNGMYAIYLYEYGTTNAAVQLTDPSYNMNHAKWYPNGFNGMTGSPTLIVAAYQQDTGGPMAPYGLASLDVSGFV